MIPRNAEMKKSKVSRHGLLTDTNICMQNEQCAGCLCLYARLQQYGPNRRSPVAAGPREPPAAGEATGRAHSPLEYTLRLRSWASFASSTSSCCCSTTSSGALQSFAHSRRQGLIPHLQLHLIQQYQNRLEMFVHIFGCIARDRLASEHSVAMQDTVHRIGLLS